MGNWYLFTVIYSEPAVFGTTPNTFFISHNVTGGVYYVDNGVLYGTSDNPIEQIQCKYLEYKSDNYTSKSWYDFIPSRNRVLFDAGFYIYRADPPHMYGYNCLVNISANLNADNTLKIENATISGKFRIKNAVTNCRYCMVDIPVKFLVDENVYTNIVFTGGLNSWYRSGSLSQVLNSRGYNSIGKRWGQVSDFNAKIYNNNTFSDTKIGPTMVDFCSSSSNWGEYTGKIVDFGNTPQDVPAFFVDWVNANFEPIYDYSYTVKSSNGENVLTSIKEAPTMTSGIVTILGNTKTLVLTGANEKQYTLQWDSVTPENKQFVGLSFSPNSSVANFPVGQEMHFNLEGDISLYECYSIYRPPATTFSVNLYKNKAEANRVDKTDYLTSVGTLNGVLRDESSITKPVITFESLDIPVFNYVYIPIFNRYYFVNDITSVKYKLWQISISVDPLMTYKDAIMQCVGFIDRNEHEFNAEIIDKKRVVEQGRTMEVHSVTNELFTGSEGTFSLSALNATAVNVE